MLLGWPTAKTFTDEEESGDSGEAGGLSPCLIELGFRRLNLWLLKSDRLQIKIFPTW